MTKAKTNKNVQDHSQTFFKCLGPFIDNLKMSKIFFGNV